MDKSQFAAVVFDQVAEFYPIDINVQCSYNLSKSIEPNKEDWVGLYKVGWTRQSNYLCYQPAGFAAESESSEDDGQSIGDHNRRGWAVFPANELPKEDGEFYQFCYVSDRHGISGASTPFQFRKASSAEFVEIEDGDMLVVRPQVDVLHEKVQELEEKKMVLMEERQKLASRVDVLEKNVLQQEGAIKKLQQALQDSHQSEKDLVLARDGLATKLAELGENAHEIFKEKEAYVSRLAAANTELEAMKVTISELESTILALKSEVKSLQSEKDELSGENQSLLDQVNSYQLQVTESQSLAAQCEKQVEGLNAKLQSAAIEYASQKQLLMQEMETESGAYDSALRKKEEQLKELESKNRNLEGCCKDLQNELENARDKLCAMEEMTTALVQDLRDSEQNMRRAQCGMEIEVRKYYEQLELVKAELRKVQDEKFALSVQLDDTEQGFKETVRTKDGELKAMAVQLEERNQQLQTTSDELQKARRDINEERLNKGVVQSEKILLGCQLQVAQDKLKRIVAIKDRELNEKTEKIQQATDKLAEANERIWLYEDISDSFDKKVEEFHQTRSYDEAYKKGLEEECRKKEKDIQETEAAMYTLQNVNDYVTTQLQAREDEVTRLVVEKTKRDDQMAAQERMIEDLNKRLELAKLEYYTLMKKHQKMMHRQGMEEESRGQSSAYSSLASDEESDPGRAEQDAQKYKHRYKLMKLERERCQDQLSKKEAAINSMEARLMEQEKEIRKLTEQNRRLLKFVATRDERIQSLQKKMESGLSMKVVLEKGGDSMGSQTASSIPEVSVSEEEEEQAEKEAKTREFRELQLHWGNPFTKAGEERAEEEEEEQKTEEPVCLALQFKNPFATGATAAAAAAAASTVATMNDLSKPVKAQKRQASCGKKWNLFKMFDMVPSSADESDSDDLQQDGDPREVSELSNPLNPEVTPGAKVAAVKHLLATKPSAEEPEVYQDCSPFFPDQSDDRFMDAMGEGMKICPQCQVSIFTTSEFEEHVATHFGRICPICKYQVDDEMIQHNFEQHVNMCCEKAAKLMQEEEGANQ